MHENDTILVADDDENDLLLLQRACQKSGLLNPLHLVRNGEQVISYLQGLKPYTDRTEYPFPSVLLLDLNMPRKTGFDVLAWIRAQELFRRLPVYVFTASMRTSDITRAYDLGANGYLVKPTDANELQHMMTCLRDWLRCNQFPPTQ